MDIAQYIGIPYARGGRDTTRALDCWGLAIHFYENEFGITLPKYDYINTSKESIDVSSEKLIETGCYRNFKTVETSKLGDLALFRIGAHPIHIGIIIDSDNMLHTFDKAGSTVERFTGLKWKSRLVSFHRHHEMI